MNVLLILIFCTFQKQNKYRRLCVLYIIYTILDIDGRVKILFGFIFNKIEDISANKSVYNLIFNIIIASDFVMSVLIVSSDFKYGEK